MDIKTEERKKLKERREYLAHALNTANVDYSKKHHGDSLSILGPLINALATATTAKVLTEGSPSLLLGLKIAFQGIENEKSRGGVIGKVLGTATKEFTDLVIETYLTKENDGNRQLFQLLSKALMLITISVFWILEQANFTYGLEQDIVENKRRKIFELELILLLILKTQAIQQIVKSMAKACGADNQRQEEISKLMKGLLLILAILTLSKGNQMTLKTIAFDLKDYLLESLEDIQAFINKATEVEKIGDKGSVISIFIQQAMASLQDEDFETLQRAYEGALEVIHANPKLMNEDIEQVGGFAKIIYNAFEQESEFTTRSTASLMI